MKDERPLESEFPVIIEVPVAWGEMDSFGHVNNIVYFRYFESARIAYFDRIGFVEEIERSGVGPILASTHCNFRRPLTYPDRVRVGAKAVDIESDRFRMLYRIDSESLGRSAAEGEGLIVSYDYERLRRAALPEVIRERIVSLEQDLST